MKFEGSLILESNAVFSVAERNAPVDLTASILFVSALVFFIILRYKNQYILNDLFTLSFNFNSILSGKKSKTHDTLDQVLLGVIFILSSSFFIYYFSQEFSFSFGLVQPLFFFLPFAVLLFLSFPFLLITSVIGQGRTSMKVLNKVLPSLYFLGLILLALGFVPFFQIVVPGYLSLALLILSAFFIIWIHLIATLELIRSGNSIFYIFMYFCTLEILPIFFVWVYFSRM